MNKIGYICLFLTFFFTFFVVESREILNAEKMKDIKEAQDSTYLQFAEILNEIGDLSSSATTINQLIAIKEFSECYDDNYVQALYKAQNIYALTDLNKAIEIGRKIEPMIKICPL